MNTLFRDIDKPFEDVIDDALTNVTQTDDDPFIIGAGFGRTGTSSLQIALAKLGYRVYHMRETSKKENKNDRKLWSDVGKMKCDLKIKNNIKSYSEWNKINIDSNSFDWNKIFNKKDVKYNGIVDFPGTAFYSEFMKHYPKYKVILTVRDNSEKWYGSMAKTLLKFPNIFKNQWVFSFVAWITNDYMMNMLDNAVWKLLFDNKYNDKEFMINKYDEWIDSVKQNVPSDNLLVFNVKAGWSPLCQFLGKAVPKNEPFPRSNDSQTMQSAINIMSKVQIITNILLIIVIGVILYFVL